jgi:EAL and modified HD-GYP domain-containing signal transduction protein
VDVLVARQAVLDGRGNLYGYELLFRSDAANNTFDGTDDAVATLQVLSNTLLSIGADKLLGGKKAFVNFDYRLLRENMHLALAPQSLVIEILERVEPTDDLLALCRTIQAQGYSLALDDFTDAPEFESLARLANVIKIDMRVSSKEEQEYMLRLYKPRGVLMLAEKVETQEDFEWARSAGYDLFQGYFFARPMVVLGQRIPTLKLACLRLLREVHQPVLDVQRLRGLIREDVSLTYQLLRYANSAIFQCRAQYTSITHVLLAMGDDNIRRWITLATLPMLATNKPGELLKLSLVRARFGERLAQLAGAGSPSDAFLMGMFSLLDALIDQPLQEALRNLDLGKELTEAILRVAPEESLLSSLYRLIYGYERGQWEEVEQLSTRSGISPAALAEAYLESTAWAENALHPGQG